MLFGPIGNRQGSIKCFHIKSGKILHRCTVTGVEEWGKKGAAAIKRGCIEFLNRTGEKFDWDNDDLSKLEVVSEQPKLVDPGVAAIPLSAAPEEELGGSCKIKSRMVADGSMQRSYEGYEKSDGSPLTARTDSASL